MEHTRADDNDNNCNETEISCCYYNSWGNKEWNDGKGYGGGKE